MLKGEKICLTPLRPSDSDILYRWMSDPATVRFNAPYKAITRDGHDRWFASLGSDPSKLILAIRERPESQVIGTIQLIDIHPIHGTAELTIRIGSDVDRGSGFGTDALRVLIDHAFRDLNLQRIWLRVFSTNERAMRAYEKAGFEREGVMRRAAWIDRAWVDEIVMAVLR